jgi:hypothetical protein
VPQPEGEEGEDYLCDACVTHPWDLDADDDDLVTACMWCARRGTAAMNVLTLEQFSQQHR